MANITQKVEYMSMDLYADLHFSFNVQKQCDELIARLNELGADGWILISGMENLRFAIFMRIISETDNV